MTIYLNTGALPLASLVYSAVPVASPEAAWTATHAPGWDPRAVVYVEGGPPLDAAPPEGASLFFSVYEANTLAVVVNTPAPAYLVLAESGLSRLAGLHRRRPGPDLPGQHRLPRDLPPGPRRAHRPAGLPARPR